jgi:hypothetical protein
MVIVSVCTNLPCGHSCVTITIEGKERVATIVAIVWPPTARRCRHLHSLVAMREVMSGVSSGEEADR